MAAPIQAQCIIPILRVENIQESFRYYTEKLLFEKRFAWGEPPEFGCVGMGRIEIFFCHNCQGCKGVWMSIFLDDVSDYLARIEKTGANIIYAPRDEPWGVREFRVQDPDDHVIRFSQGLEAFSL
jgi:uncharacterized glyoxalase superfamily protein PhnB